MQFHGPGTGRANSRTRGASLSEMLITLAIFGILLGAGIPGMASLTARTHAAGSMLELHGLLGLARQTAVTHHNTVTLCGTTDGRSCARDWYQQPTLVFLDRDGNRHADADDTIIVVSDLTRNGRIRWRASGGRNYLRFDAGGGVREFGSFQYCPDNDDPREARQIILSATGRARSATDSDGDGVVEGSDGKALRCPFH